MNLESIKLWVKENKIECKEYFKMNSKQKWKSKGKC
jgi:hypothetical protein